MTPQMDVALGAQRVMLLGLLEITFPSHTLRLCDGSATVSWAGKVFTGRDAVFGTLGEVEEIAEEAGDTMPGLDIVLMPPDLSSAVQLCNPSMQGAPVRVWLAAVNPETGAIVPDPDLLFAGEVDLPILEVDRGVRTVTMQIASVFERLMEPDEGMRLADAVHQSIWPGELGLANMTGTPIKKLWGPGDVPPSYTDVPQGGGGGVDYRLPEFLP